MLKIFLFIITFYAAGTNNLFAQGLSPKAPFPPRSAMAFSGSELAKYWMAEEENGKNAELTDRKSVV